MLFLISGNIVTAYRSKSVNEVTGLIRVLPFTGVLWVAGLLAITGSPPFGTFISELTILQAALQGGRYWIAAGYLALLAIIFVGMATAMLRMAEGAAPETGPPRRWEPASWVGVPAVLAIATLLLGIWLPRPISDALHEVASALGGS
jgi:hydrogenase-4 component F